jgi:hypothetical protein
MNDSNLMAEECAVVHKSLAYFACPSVIPPFFFDGLFNGKPRPFVMEKGKWINQCTVQIPHNRVNIFILGGWKIAYEVSEPVTLETPAGSQAARKL